MFGIGNPTKVVSTPLGPRAGWSGFSRPNPHGCLPPGGRPALGRGISDSDMDTSAWLIFGSGTGLASNSQQPTELPLSGQGILAREGGGGRQEELSRLESGCFQRLRGAFGLLVLLVPVWCE